MYPKGVRKATGRVSAANLSRLAKQLGRCGDVNPLSGYVCVIQIHDEDVKRSYEDDVRAQVSALWAEDWDCEEDSVYDGDESKRSGCSFRFQRFVVFIGHPTGAHAPRWRLVRHAAVQIGGPFDGKVWAEW